MLGNESLREVFAIGPPSDEVAREYLYWLRHTRRRTALTVYQYAGKLESFLAWIDHDSLANVDTTTRPGLNALGVGEATANPRGVIDRDPTVLVYTPAPKNDNPRHSSAMCSGRSLSTSGKCSDFAWAAGRRASARRAVSLAARSHSGIAPRAAPSFPTPRSK